MAGQWERGLCDSDRKGPLIFFELPVHLSVPTLVAYFFKGRFSCQLPNPSRSKTGF